MANVDASAGADRYAALRTNRPGYCLWETQVHGYEAPASIGPHAGQYPTAYSAWVNDSNKHTDANPPKGAPVYFGISPTRTDANKNAGDICISLGNGLIRCSDGGGSGVMATMTIPARSKQIARPYLGWIDPIYLGHTLVNLGPITTGGAPVASNTLSAATITTLLGDAYVKAWQTQLGVTADGAFGPASTKALQAKIGTAADGVFGQGTIKALQANLGIAQDGLWGGATTVAVKHSIDSSHWAPVVVTPPPATWTPPTQAEYEALQKQEADAVAAIGPLQSQLSTANVALAAANAKILAAEKALA